MIVTTEVDDEGDNFRNASITDYDEDLDVSFSKYESGLGNRKLKDQLSLVSGSIVLIRNGRTVLAHVSFACITVSVWYLHLVTEVII